MSPTVLCAAIEDSRNRIIEEDNQFQEEQLAWELEHIFRSAAEKLPRRRLVDILADDPADLFGKGAV